MADEDVGDLVTKKYKEMKEALKHLVPPLEDDKAYMIYQYALVRLVSDAGVAASVDPPDDDDTAEEGGE